MKKPNFANTVPYQTEYLAGHIATRYDQDPAAAFEEVRRSVDTAPIPKDIRDDIGGHQTQVSSTVDPAKFTMLLKWLGMLAVLALGLIAVVWVLNLG